MKNKIFLGVKGVKTIAFLFLTLLMILPLSSCYNKENREEILKVYNWGDYIDEEEHDEREGCTIVPHRIVDVLLDGGTEELDVVHREQL
jgi:spermidine/putrescine-binding protein